jgi:hypothetical protein
MSSASGSTAKAPTADAMARRIETAGKAFAGRRSALLAWHEAGGPGKATMDPAAPWDPGRVLAHTAEMLRFWQGEMERLLAGGSDPVTVGRFEPETIRILTVERDRDLPVDELLGRIESDVQRLVARLDAVDDTTLAKPGIHLYYANRGVMTAGEIINASLAKHVEAHLTQLDEALAAATKSSHDG